MALPPDTDVTGPVHPDADRDGVRFRAGTLLLGRFRIVRLLGAGGMGEVYEAEDQELREQIALKTIRLRHSQDLSMIDRLRKEVQLGRRIGHPNVCRLFDVFRVSLPPAPDQPAVECAIVTMQLLRGSTLSDRIRREGGMSPDEALPFAQQIADGLQAAHAAGVVHRDLKSANVFLARADGSVRAVITDFGLATTVTPGGGDWPELTLTGAVVGTLSYMSPEQLRGEPATTLSDIYAFGVVLYEMVSGVLPFRAVTPMAAALKRVNEKPDDLRRHLPDVPQPWHDTIHRCLALEPRDRFQTAVDVAVGLTRELTWRDRPVLRWTAAVAAVVAILGGAYAYVSFLKRANVPEVERSEVPTRARPAVALFGFKNVSAREEFAYISTALDQGLGSELASGEQLRIVSGEEVARTKQELELPAVDTLARDTLQKVRASLGSDLLVLGSYTAVGAPGAGQLRVDFRVQNTVSGETVAAWSHQGSEAELLTLISESGTAVRQRLGLSGAGDRFASGNVREPGGAGVAGSPGLPSAPEAQRLYAEGLDALRGFDASTARDLFERAIKQEPGFALAHVGLAMAWAVLGYDAQAVREAATASELARSMRNEQRVWIDALYREYTRDWPRAIAAYRQLAADYPDEPEYVLRLADAQTSGGIPTDALATIDNARKTMPGLRDDPRLLLAEASAAEALGDAKRQESAARQAVGQAERRGARLLVARASIALGRSRQLLGDPVAAVQANESALKLYEKAGDRRGVARALIQLGDLARQRGDLPTAEQQLTTALEISRSIGTRRQTTQSLNELANVYFDAGKFAPAASMYEDAIRVSREVGDQNAEALALGNLASVRYEQGNVVEALRLDEQSLSIKRKVGDRRSVAFSLTNMAETAGDLGRLDAAQKMYEESRDINMALGDKAELSYALSGLSTVATRRDDLPAARRLLEEAIRLRTEVSDADGVLDARVGLAAVSAEQGQVKEAGEAIAAVQGRLGGGASETATRAVVVQASLLLAERRLKEARAALSALLQRRTADHGLATGASLTLTNVRLLAAEGNVEVAIRAAREMRDRMRSRQLLAFELEAELVLAQLQPSVTGATEQVAARARRAGFLLIARKAAGR